MGRFQNESGFTLIEVMAAVAIVGILTAVAIPAYQDYVIRSQVSEAMTLAAGAKSPIAEYFANHGAFPADSASAGVTTATGKYISSVDVGEGGKIVAKLGGEASSKVANKTFSLTPKLETAGNISWNCESDIDKRYLSMNCDAIASEPTSPTDSSNPSSGDADGGTPPTDPSDGNSDSTQPSDLAPAPYSQDAYYGELQMQYVNGVLTEGNGFWTYTLASTDPDGTMHFTSSVGNAEIKPDGTLLIFDDDGRVDEIETASAQPDGSGSTDADLTYYSSGTYSNIPMVDIFDQGGIDGASPYYPLISSLEKASNNFDRSDKHPTDYANYNSALSSFKSSMDALRNSDGTYPSDLPSIYIQLYDAIS